MTPEQFVAKWSAVELSERGRLPLPFQRPLLTSSASKTPSNPTPPATTTPSKNPSTPSPPPPKAPRATPASSTSGNAAISPGNTNAKANTKTSPKPTARSTNTATPSTTRPSPSSATSPPPKSTPTSPATPNAKSPSSSRKSPASFDVLRRVFTDPNSFQPAKNHRQGHRRTRPDLRRSRQPPHRPLPVTELHLWETAGSPVAHFLMKVIFCLFAEDIGLLPRNLFTNLINDCLFDPDSSGRCLLVRCRWITLRFEC